EKYFNLAFLTKSIIHLQANNPDKKAATNPQNRGKISKDISAVPVVDEASKYSLAAAPIIKGNTIKNEKRAALDLSSPNIIDVEMVEPEREIPGKMAATAWAKPMINESLKLMSFPVFLARSAMYSNSAVTKSINPTNLRFENNSSNVSFKNNPTKAAGIIDKTIFNEK